MAQILLVDDQRSVLTSLSILLKRQGHEVTAKTNAVEAQDLMVQRTFDLILTDLRMARHLEGMEVLRSALEIQPDVPVIIMTGFGTIDNAVEAIKMGAFDYITKGFTNQEFLDKIDRALQQGKWISVEHGASDDHRPGGFDRIIGQSPGMLKILQLVDKVAPSDSAILIQGESGTGKELIARAVTKATGAVCVNLLRRKKGDSQVGLTAEERAANIRGKFYLSGRPEQPGRIWVLDDVMTTGATMLECIAVLEDAGVKEPAAAVVCFRKPEDESIIQGKEVIYGGV